MDDDFDGLLDDDDRIPKSRLEWAEQTVTAEFHLTLDTILGSRDDQPYTVGDVIINVAAEKLAGQAKSDASYSFSNRVYEKVESRLDAKADELVEQMWERQVTKTDRFGRSSGEPTSLEAWAADRIETWLNDRTDYGRGPSRLSKAIESVLDRKLAKQLDDAIAGAKEQALSAVTKVAEEHLSKALRDSIAAAGKAT